MPLVELAGASGVGKSTLMHRLLQLPELTRWQSTLPSPSEIKNEKLSFTQLRLLVLKNRLVYERTQSTKGREIAMSVSRRHLRIGAALARTEETHFTIMEEHLLQFFLEPLQVLAQRHREKARVLMQQRSVILLTSDPKLILRQYRKRQTAGAWRPGLDDMDDETLLHSAASFQQGLIDFVHSISDFDCACLVIDMRSGIEVATRQAKAFLQGIENIHGQATKAPD
jgi:hypothetical protein